MSNRYLPMNWVPRWMEAYYTTDSLLKKLYFLGIYYSNDLMKSLLYDKLIPTYYGNTGGDRYTYIAKYDYPKNFIPSISLYSTGGSSIVREADSIGTLLYELKTPSYFKGETHLYFKNLDIRSVAVSALSGFIDLTTAFSQESIDEDSPLVIENQWGDCFYIDQSSISYVPASAYLQVPYNGGYTVYYRSSARRTQLLNGDDYITIENERVPIKLVYHKNSWDYFAEMYSLRRNKWETNTDLKQRCQHSTIAQKANQRIAAALAQSIGFYWRPSDTTNTVNLSGYNDVALQEYPVFKYTIKEVPTLVGSSYFLSKPSTGHVQLLLNGKTIDTNLYTVTGSLIILDSELYRESLDNRLSVSYKTQSFSIDDFIDAQQVFGKQFEEDKLYPGILIRDTVVVEDTVRKVKPTEWKWNKIPTGLSGLADFDF